MNEARRDWPGMRLMRVVHDRPDLARQGGVRGLQLFQLCTYS